MTDIATSYQPPVDKLLTSEQPKRHGTEMDYGKSGIGGEQAPELIRMAIDEALNGVSFSTASAA